MMVRTYGRRSRGLSDSTLNGDVSDDPFSFSEEDDEDSPQDYNFTFSSSQDSARWTFDSEPYRDADPDLTQKKQVQLFEPVEGSRGGSKKPKNEKGESRFSRPPLPPPTFVQATLMETQEFGEMMEYVDEVNFALDGLKRRQPVRVRRASLLSLLTICETSHQRRLLRAHGMGKMIVDAIMSLSLDDPPSNLAASALFYVLTADGQDNYLLDSSSGIGFLIKLLKPLESDKFVKKTTSIGSKLLAFRKDAHISQDMTKKFDSSGDAIAEKVKEILVSCKDIKASDDAIHEVSRPELTPKWIALLTMEKACLSNVSFEDGTARRTGGNFKETLRELGGLDAIFELAISFRSSLQSWLDHASATNKASKDEDNLQCVVLLSKCLKIMENATFLSKENQSHLLAMRQSLANTKSSLSFTKLVTNFVKILSDLCLLRRNSLTASADEMPLNFSTESEKSPDFLSGAENKDITDDSSRVSLTRYSQECSSSGRVFPGLGSKKSQSKQWLSAQSGSLEPATTYIEDNCMIKLRIKSSKSSSSSMTSKSTGCGAMINDARLKMKRSLGKRPYDIEDDGGFTNIEDNEDPFAFNEDDSKSTGGRATIGGACLKKKSSLAKRPYDIDDDDGFTNIEDSEDPFAFTEDDSKSTGVRPTIGVACLKKKSSLAKRPYDIDDDDGFTNIEDREDPFAFNEDDSKSTGGRATIGGACLKKKSSIAKRPYDIDDDDGFTNIEDSEDPFAFNEDDSKSTGCRATIDSACLKKKSSLGKRPYDFKDDDFTNLEDSEDPYAFDEGEFKPSKWDVLARKKGDARAKKRKVGRGACKKIENGCTSRPILKQDEVKIENGCSSRSILKQDEVKHIEMQHSSQTSCSSVVDEETSDILAECLLTSVKVLMNVTNDNEIGCQQIAASGGLETLSSLIANHFPSYLPPLDSPSEMRDFDTLCNSVIDLESQTDVRLSDQEIDLLVAILGLLVNMVEKDDRNRSRLAATSISLPCSRGLGEESQRDVISLLCSIFLANQGAGEAVGEVNETWDHEAVLLQGEKEAEKMIIEAYSALLLAFLSNESQSTRETIARYLPTKKLSILVPVLERFVTFHVTLDMISRETEITVNEVIESLRIT